ncbi:PE-PPE domain-containing protein [Streptomyces noursei]|uniref:PE-PPE domain-containing protein n=1 Tax=Streptomyces noursei TaxID=1971 RepID=UPI0033C275E6
MEDGDRHGRRDGRGGPHRRHAHRRPRGSGAPLLPGDRRHGLGGARARLHLHLRVRQQAPRRRHPGARLLPGERRPLAQRPQRPDVGALSYDASVREGYRNLLAAAEKTYHRDPQARFTIVGYSQGAQAADQVLRTIAEGRTAIPRSQVNGMLYADPMQPGTGIWARVPQGWSALGFTSTGAAPAKYDGVPVRRFCIRTDLACDATSIRSVPGFLNQHPKYWQEGNVMTQTIGHDGGDGTTWYDAQ